MEKEFERVAIRDYNEHIDYFSKPSNPLDASFLKALFYISVYHH